MRLLTPTLTGHAVEVWAGRIRERWQESVEAIFDVGRLLIRAKAALEHGDWETLCNTRLPFKADAARKLMAIANDERLLKPDHGPVLPPHWRTLYELTTLDDDVLDAAFANGVVAPDMERSAITNRVKAQKRIERERALGSKQCALPQKKYGVIVADPEWQFEPWSDKTGMDRAADNHYPTSPVDRIIARDVGAIAADDCVLFLWATAPCLEYALAVLNGWGFSYKSQFVWDKLIAGTGYWNRNRHELLLIGTQGKIPAPAMGEQEHSIISAQKGKHSAKPEKFLQLIENYFPTLPKIELNRRGPPRPGWDAWGNESEKAPSPVTPAPQPQREAALAPVADSATGAPVEPYVPFEDLP